MSILTAEQKKNLKGPINFFGYLLTIFVMLALACKYVLSGYPPIIAWLEPFAELVIVLGAIMLGIVIYNKNPLIKG